MAGPLALLGRLTAPLRRARGGPRGLPGRSGYLAALGVAGGLVLGAAGLVTAVDPYELYPWGARPSLDQDRYSRLARPWLVNVAAKGGIDTVLVGGSTVEALRADDMEAVLSGVRRAFTITYQGPGPQDLSVVMDRLARAPSVERVFLTYDVTWLLPADRAKPTFPFELYDADPINDLDAVTPAAVRLAANLATRGDYFIPDWSTAPIEAREAARHAQGQSAAAGAGLRRSLERQGPGVDRPTSLTCADFDALPRITGFARAFRARGKRLEIILPPYAYAAYFMEPGRRWRFEGEPPLAMLIQSRRCLFEALKDHPEVRVHGFDLDAEIVADMANYTDVTHPHGRAIGRALLARIERGDHLVTAETHEAYAAELRRRVKAYRLYNSRARW